jgi:hypothetical protein
MMGAIYRTTVSLKVVPEVRYVVLILSISATSGAQLPAPLDRQHSRKLPLSLCGRDRAISASCLASETPTTPNACRKALGIAQNGGTPASHITSLTSFQAVVRLQGHKRLCAETVAPVQNKLGGLLTDRASTGRW